MNGFTRIALLQAVMIFSLSPALAEWRPATALPTSVPKAVAAEMENRLYVMSGAVGAGLRQFFELYDIANDGWRPLTPLPASLSDFSMAAGEGRVFVSGGRETETLVASNSLWMYAPENALWLELARMPFTRAGHTSFVANNQVFIIGGEGERANSVHSYDIDTGKWKQWSDQMPVSVSNSAAAKYGDEYILAGGTNDQGQDVSAVQAFNPMTGNWRRLADLPRASSGGALGLVNGQLHYAGGYSQSAQRVLNTHVKLVKNDWEKISNLPEARHQMAYYGTGNELIIIGGAMGGGFYSLFTASDRVTIYRP